jgi:hypothetical protein
MKLLITGGCGFLVSNLDSEKTMSSFLTVYIAMDQE